MHHAGCVNGGGGVQWEARAEDCRWCGCVSVCEHLVHAAVCLCVVDTSDMLLCVCVCVCVNIVCMRTLLASVVGNVTRLFITQLTATCGYLSARCWGHVPYALQAQLSYFRRAVSCMWLESACTSMPHWRVRVDRSFSYCCSLCTNWPSLSAGQSVDSGVLPCGMSTCLAGGRGGGMLYSMVLRAGF